LQWLAHVSSIPHTYTVVAAARNQVHTILDRLQAERTTGMRPSDTVLARWWWPDTRGNNTNVAAHRQRGEVQRRDAGRAVFAEKGEWISGE
jgi:hypothetical protein